MTTPHRTASTSSRPSRLKNAALILALLLVILITWPLGRRNWQEADRRVLRDTAGQVAYAAALSREPTCTLILSPDFSLWFPPTRGSHSQVVVTDRNDRFVATLITPGNLTAVTCTRTGTQVNARVSGSSLGQIFFGAAQGPLRTATPPLGPDHRP